MIAWYIFWSTTFFLMFCFKVLKFVSGSSFILKSAWCFQSLFLKFSISLFYCFKCSWFSSFETELDIEFSLTCKKLMVTIGLLLQTLCFKTLFQMMRNCQYLPFSLLKNSGRYEEISTKKKKSTNNKCCKEYREKGTLLHCCGNINWCRHYGEQYGSFLRN